MFRCLVAPGTEPTPGARAQEAARLVSQFIGDMCVVALASEDRRSFGPFAVESRDPRMTGAMRRAVETVNLSGRSIGPGVVELLEQELAAVVLLARAVGRRTIAELVPDQETLELLGELGVDLVQGFHIGRPRPVEEPR